MLARAKFLVFYQGPSLPPLAVAPFGSVAFLVGTGPSRVVRWSLEAC